jgi:hypothetical protein
MTLIEQKNLAYCQKALALKKNIEVSYLKLGEMLYNIRQDRLFEPQWSSFREYVMEFKIPESTASRLISIYEIFVLKFGFASTQIVEVGWTNLAATLPQIKTKADAKKWLTTAGQLSQRDLRMELTEAKTGVQMRDCKHPNAVKILYCPDCGFKEQIHAA